MSLLNTSLIDFLYNATLIRQTPKRFACIAHCINKTRTQLLIILLFFLVCRFRIDNTDHIIDVNRGNVAYEYDQINIVCPTYSKGTREEDIESYIIYNVSVFVDHLIGVICIRCNCFCYCRIFGNLSFWSDQCPLQSAIRLSLSPVCVLYLTRTIVFCVCMFPSTEWVIEPISGTACHWRAVMWAHILLCSLFAHKCSQFGLDYRCSHSLHQASVASFVSVCWASDRLAIEILVNAIWHFCRQLTIFVGGCAWTIVVYHM